MTTRRWLSAIVTLARKDLLLLWRDRVALFWMVAFPLIFAAFFGSIFGGAGPQTRAAMRIAVVDDGLGEAARAFVARLEASDAAEVERMSLDAARNAVRTGEKTAFIRLLRPPAEGFAMFHAAPAEIEVGIDPSRQAERGLLRGLLIEAAFGGFRDLLADPDQRRAAARRAVEQIDEADGLPALHRGLLTTFFTALEELMTTVESSDGRVAGGGIEPRLIDVPIDRERRGPPNAYSVSFPQSILWALIGGAAGFAITLVRERRDGTVLRLLASPVPRGAILAGKALACGIAGCLVVFILTGVGAIAFGVRVDSIPALLLATACAAACCAGLSTLLSSFGRSEQAVAGIAWGVLLLFAMLGGGMVPQIAMPGWMLDLGAVSPARWIIEALEGAIWRGYSLGELLLPCAILLAIAALGFSIGAWRIARERA